MAKGKAKDEAQPALFRDTKDIIAMLDKEAEQDVVMIAVPSRDKLKRELGPAKMAEWAKIGMELVADLYGGGTSFEAHAGIYKSKSGEYLWDKPIIIEAFATHEAIHDPARLNLLVDYAKRMGKTLEQESVMLVFGTMMYYVEDYGGV